MYFNSTMMKLCRKSTVPIVECIFCDSLYNSNYFKQCPQCHTQKNAKK